MKRKTALLSCHQLLCLLLALTTFTLPARSHEIPARAGAAAITDPYFETGLFVIRTNRSYRYIAIRDKNAVAGALADIEDYIGDLQYQGWNFRPAGGGYYRIKSPTGLCLSQKRLLTLTVEPEANEDSQLWLLSETGDGFYTILSKTGKYLANNNNIQKHKMPVMFAAAPDGTDKQQWHLVKMTEDGRRMTRFVPEVNGFKFANTFAGVDASYRYGGLCGGMVYAAMDYYRTGRTLPTQTYRPANRTPLQSYIFGRQNDAAMVNQFDKWTELRMNPFGWRDAEFFEWGLKGTGGGRIEELRAMIDAGDPAPLGVYEGGTKDYAGESYGDHQILAVGYAMGRYRGDLGAHKQDFKILVYDPNHPWITLTMVADISRKCYFYIESPDTRRTYFVDRKYSPKTPPDISSLAANEPDGSIRHIYLSFQTGGDDLRGGNDNVNVTVNYRDGSRQEFPNVNGGARWVDNYTETVPLVLNRAVRKSDILNFEITTTFGGGFNGDNWNLDRFWVDNGGNIQLVCARCGKDDPLPLQRFTGDQKRLVVRVE